MTFHASQSDFVCHGGAIAGLKEWMKGCMSVVERSCFSYQVAAGSTTSLKIVDDVIRKSIVISRSSRPSAAFSAHTTSLGRLSGGASTAVAAESVPSRWRRKYSLPFADEPSRLERHSDSTRGWLSSCSGSSTANRSRPAFSSAATYAGASSPAASASSASCRLLRSKVGYDGDHPSRTDCASRSITVLPAKTPVPESRSSAVKVS